MGSAMNGRLFEYAKGLTAFESGEISSRCSVILIGGIGDGLLTIPYAVQLSKCLEENNWSLIQILMKSSYTNYGMSSLEEDAYCILDLLRYLKEKGNKTKIVLLGHSTGCQDIMWLCSKWNEDEDFDFLRGFVVSGILQAPVSDREYAYFKSPAEAEELLSWANSNLPSAVHPTYRPQITAYRIKALYERLGDDDFFSTDITLEERRAKLGHIPIPLHIIFSSKDEYFPHKNRLEPFLQSMREAWPEIKSCQVVAADHGLVHEGDQLALIERLLDIIR